MMPSFASRWKAFLCFTFLFMMANAGHTQPLQHSVTLIIDGVPAETPPGDTLFLTGSFNDWNPRDSRYIFRQEPDGKYVLRVARTLLPFQYKITRGSWEKVEGDIQGKKLADRQLTQDVTDAHVIQLLSWEDMVQLKSWNLVVTSVPDNTPFQADIFVSGSFNDWKDYDVRYKLKVLSDGTYGIKIPKQASDTLWFKFHRGSWQSVECRANGRTLENRTCIWNNAGITTSYTATVTTWEDLAGGTNQLFSFLLACAIANAVVFLLAILFVPAHNGNVRTLTLVVTGVVALALFARMASYSRLVFDWWSKLLLMADFSYFIVGPLLLLLMVRLLQLELPFRRLVLFVPAVVQAVIYAPIFAMPTQQFVNDNLNYQFEDLFAYSAALGCFYNAGLWIYCLYLLRKQNAQLTANANAYLYGKRVMVVTASLLLVWLFSLIIAGVNKLFFTDFRFVHEYAVDASWLVLSMLVYVNMFHALRYPILLHAVHASAIEEERRTSPHTKEDLESLKQQLEQVMRKRKPYLNAGLGLQDLAEAISVNMHTVSWVINEGFKKNFFDFINEYRIEEFKRLVSHEQYKRYTFLALALEVGFSSKTTFNRAFKKFTGKTPREYFGSEGDMQLEGTS